MPESILKPRKKTNKDIEDVIKKPTEASVETDTKVVKRVLLHSH